MSLANIKNISIIGGGMAAVLLCNEAAKKGIATTLLDPDIQALGSNVASEHMIGSITEENLQKLALRSDAIIYNGNTYSMLNEKFRCSLYPRAHMINKLNNKYEILQLAQSLKIPVPAFYYQENKSLLMQEIKEISIPFRFYQFYEKRVEKLEIHTEADLSNFIFEIDERADAWLIEVINDYQKRVINLIVKDHRDTAVVYSSFEKTFAKGSLDSISTPASISKSMLQKLNAYTNKLAKNLEGPGIYSVKFGIKKNRSAELVDVTPKIDITGILTQTSFDISIYEQIINMILGYPLVTPKQVSAACGHIFSENKKDQLINHPNSAYHIYSARHNHIYIEQMPIDQTINKKNISDNQTPSDEEAASGQSEKQTAARKKSTSKKSTGKDTKINSTTNKNSKKDQI